MKPTDPHGPKDEWTTLDSRDLVQRGILRAVNAEMLWPLGLALTVTAGILGPVRARLKKEGLSDEAIGRALMRLPDHFVTIQATDDVVTSGLSDELGAERDAAWAAFVEERRRAVGATD